MFNAPIDPFIQEHTADVSVASLDVTGAVWQPGNNGYLVSGSDVEITVHLNNPAGIDLAFTAACFINGVETPANVPGGRCEYKKTNNDTVWIKISGITSSPGERIDIRLGIQTADGTRSFSPYSCPSLATNTALLAEVAATGGITYPSLSAALDAAAAGTEAAPAVVTLLKSTEFPETSSAAYTISAKHIKLTSNAGGPYTVTHKSGHSDTLFEIASGSFVLENITITGNGSDGSSSIQVKASSKLTMGTNAVLKNFTSSANGAVFVHSSAVFTMKGNALITGNAMNNGGAVYIGGTFNMEGGSITGNIAALYGSGVYVAGTFTMSGGARITGNDVYLNGTTITVANTFSSSPAGIVATISPSAYISGTQVLSESSPGLMASEHSRFAVTTSTYHVDSNGKLVTW